MLCGRAGMRCPIQKVGLCGVTSHLHFLVFGAQEAGACHGQVHPEHTEEQQAADGPWGGHGLGWVETDGPRGERVSS